MRRSAIGAGGAPAAILLLLAWLAPLSQGAQGPATDPDPVLRAMQQELERSRALRLVELDEPYFIEYALDDARSFSVSATLGALISKNRNHFRVPRVQVRVGGYKFDNTNYVLTDVFSGGLSFGQAPLDDDTLVLRNFLWLATDRAYKGAVAAIARKRAALRNVTVAEELDDFSRAEPVRMVLEIDQRTPEELLWTTRVRNLSALFAGYPKLIRSQVSFEDVQSASYLANSEGTLVRYPDHLSYLRIRAEGQAPDGMMVRDAAVVQALNAGSLPSGLELQRVAQSVAENVSALVGAAVGDSYVGPVLFEDQAAPQLFAQLLGGNLAVPRRPVAEPGRPAPFQPSELEGRIGLRILPEWMDVVDDPTQTHWRGRSLFGHYLLDMEGVVPEPLTLVERGVLKGFLLTRQPAKGHSGSNGRARLPGRFGAKAASFGNLFISASETVSVPALRRRLMEICEQRNKPYGIVIRKLDFPSSASLGELRRLSAGARERGGGGRLISSPALVYRVYPDGREQLVRGLEFRGVSVRSLRDIVAASDESHLFDYMGNTAALSLMGAGGFVTANAVVAPSVLFEDLELERVEEGTPTLPVVPPPELSAPR